MSLENLQSSRRYTGETLTTILPREKFSSDDSYKEYLLGKYHEIKMTQFRYLARNEAMSLYNREMYAISEGQYVSGPEPNELVHNDYGVWNNYRMDGFRATENKVTKDVYYDVGNEFLDNPAKYASSITKYYEEQYIDNTAIYTDLNEKRRKYKNLVGNERIEAINRDLKKEGKSYRIDKDHKIQYLGLDGGESCAIGANCTVYSMLKEMGYENNPFVNTTGYALPGLASNVACAEGNSYYTVKGYNPQMSVADAINSGHLKEGDAFAEPREGGSGHARFVAGIIRDESGKVTHVTIAETNPTNMRNYSIDELREETYQNGAQINDWVSAQVSNEVNNMQNMSVEQILGAVNREVGKLNNVTNKLEATENACHRKGYDSWCCLRYCKLDKNSNETATHCLASSYDLYMGQETQYTNTYLAQNKKASVDYTSYACAEQIISMVKNENIIYPASSNMNDMFSYNLENMQPAFRELLVSKINDQSCDATQWLASIIGKNYEALASLNDRNDMSGFVPLPLNYLGVDKELVNDVICSLSVKNEGNLSEIDGKCISWHYVDSADDNFYFCNSPERRDSFLAMIYLKDTGRIAEDEYVANEYIGYLEYIKNKDNFKPDENGNVSVKYKVVDEKYRILVSNFPDVSPVMKEYTVTLSSERIQMFDEAYKYIQENFYGVKTDENVNDVARGDIKQGMYNNERLAYTRYNIASNNVISSGNDSFDYALDNERKSNTSTVELGVIIDRQNEV